MRLLFAFALASASFWVSRAVAGSPDMSALPVERLGSVVSDPGEDEQAFALRVAPTLSEYTHRTGFEACGALASDGSRFGVALGSNHSQIGCAVGAVGLPDGMKWIGKTIHSHSEKASFALTKNDRFFVDAAGPDAAEPIYHNVPKGFSWADCAGPAGYLVAGKTVWYRTASKFDRGKRVGRIP